MANDNKISLQMREDKILDILLHAATREDIGRLDTKIDESITRLDTKIDRLNTKIDENTARLDIKIDTSTTKLDNKLNQLIFGVGFVILIQILFQFFPH